MRGGRLGAFVAAWLASAACTRNAPSDAPAGDAASVVAISSANGGVADASDASAMANLSNAVDDTAAAAAALASAIAALPDAASIPYVNIGAPNGGMGPDGKLRLRKSEMDRLERAARSDGGDISP